MSINSAMLAGVTGLTANASALAATSDNIANVNTIGYKRNITEFSNLVTAASAQDYSAGGTQALTSQYVSQQGLIQSSASPTDLAISGQGFFVTTEQATGLSAASPRLFTRAGSFTVDNLGYLKNPAGLYLQGWIADSSGQVTTDPSNINLLQPINVSSVGGAAGQTTIASVNANLDASQVISQAATDAAATPVGAGTKPDFSITIPLADSQGGARTMEIDMLKSAANPNQWYAEARIVPASAVVTGTGLQGGQISTGIIAFTPDGRMDPTNTTLFGGAPTSTSWPRTPRRPWRPPTCSGPRAWASTAKP